jgi:phosphoesterase RecJ-like protein
LENQMKNLSETQVAAFKAFVAEHDSFIVSGHKEPDGDCLMSCLGMAAILRHLGKTCTLFSAGPFKRSELRHLETTFTSTIPAFPATVLYPALIMLDCSEVERLADDRTDQGTIDRLSQLDRFVIDHHRTGVAASTAATIIDADSPATTLLVQQLYQNLVGPLDEKTAGELFFGLATDTGFFRFLPPGSGNVFRLAADLTDAGANPRTIADDVAGSKPFSTRRLLGQMLLRAELHFDEQVVYTWETMGDTARHGKEGRDSEALYNLFLTVEKVRAVVFIRQESRDKCTVGMRSRGTLNVGAIAAKFGGGGHINAAGMTAHGSIRDVRDMIFAELKEAL